MRASTILAIAFLSTYGTAQSAPTPSELVERIERAESAIVNLHVSGFVQTEERHEPGSDIWAATPLRLEGDAWLNGLPGSQIRIDFKRRIVPWEGGSAAWAHSEAEMAFDGSISTAVTHRSGTADKLVPVRQGVIQYERIRWLDEPLTGHATGALFSLNYFRYPRGALSHCLREDIASNKPLSVTDDVVRGRKAVKLRMDISDRGPAAVYWFSVDEGFALLRLEHYAIVGEAVVMEEFKEVIELKEAAPNCWYPIKAVWERPDRRKPGARVRWHYQVVDVAANNPQLDRSTFVVRFPPMYQITDQVNKTSFISGYPPDELARAMEPLAAEERKLKQDVVPPSGLSTTPRTDRESRRALLVLPAIAAGIMLLSLLVWVYLRRRRQRRNILMLIAAAVMLNSAPVADAAEGRDIGLPQYKASYQLNCGLNAVAFIAQLFELNSNNAALAETMNAGAMYGWRWECL